MAALQFPGSRKDLVVRDSGRYNRCTGVWGGGSGKRGKGVHVRACWVEVKGYGKGKKTEGKGKEESLEWCLKMNEKMGNPRVAA